MTDTNKSKLIQNFANGHVPTEDDFAALINLADSSAAALGANTGDVSKPVGDGVALGGLQVKGGKLTVVTDPKSPLTAPAGGLTLACNGAHLQVTNKGLGVFLHEKGGLDIAPDDKGRGLMVSHGPGLILGSDGKLAVDAGAGLAPDPKDANKLSVNVGKGLALDTQAPNALIVNVSQKGGLDFEGTALKVKLPTGSALTQDAASGLSLSEATVKTLTAASSGRFREALSRVNPDMFLKGIAAADYAQIRQCFDRALAYAKSSNFQAKDVLTGSMLVAPDYGGGETEFKLIKPDGSVVGGQGAKGVFVFDTVGYHGLKADSLPDKFSIAVGSVNKEGDYANDNDKFTQNALLLYKDKSREKASVRTLGWWDLNEVMKTPPAGKGPALNTGWHAWAPVLLEPAQPWDAVLSGLYGHQDEIAALTTMLDLLLGKFTKKRSSLSLSLESQGDDVFVCTSAGERAMHTGHMWILKSDTQVLSGDELKSLDNPEAWAKGCYLFLGETNDQTSLHGDSAYYTRNALVVWVGEKNATTGKADIVRVIGSFILSEDGKHAQWQPVVPGVMAQGAERLREAMNRVNPSLAVKGIVAEDYLQIRRCFENAFAFAKEKGFTADWILPDSTLVAPAYGGTQTAFSLIKKDGSLVDGEGANGTFVFDSEKYQSMKYASLPEKFSIAVGSVTDEGDYSGSNHKFAHNALLLFKEKKDDVHSVRVLGWWDLSVVLKKTDSVPALDTGWHAWAPVVLEPTRPWDEVISGLYTHEGETGALKARLDVILASDAKMHNPPVVSLGLEKRGTDTIIASSYGESAMPDGYAWLFKSSSEEIKSPYAPLEKWEAGCYLTLGHTDENGSFTGTITRFTKNALIIEVGPNPTKTKPEYIRVIGNFILTGDGKRADWQPLVAAGATPVQGLMTARQALGDRLQALMKAHTHTYECARINVSASTEEILSGFYYGNNGRYAPETLSVFMAGADGAAAGGDMTKWKDGYYAVAATLNAEGKTPTKDGPAITANAVMLSKFSDAISVVGYWDLAHGDTPEWYQTEPDPVLYDTVRDSGALTLKFDGKTDVADGQTLPQTIKNKNESHSMAALGGNGQPVVWISSNEETVSIDKDSGAMTFHQWGADVSIQAVQLSNRYKNIKRASFLLKIGPKGKNEIKGGIPNVVYSKEKLNELNDKFNTVKASEGAIQWVSSAPEMLKVDGGKLVAGAAFKGQEITLTAKSSSSDLLESDSKGFVFTFKENSLLESTLTLARNYASVVGDGTMTISVVVYHGNGKPPYLFNEAGDNWFSGEIFEMSAQDGCWHFYSPGHIKNEKLVKQLEAGSFYVIEDADTTMNGSKIQLKFKVD